MLQAIKDAEADERIADQLAALQLTLSQLADQQQVGNTAEAVTHADDTTTAGSHSQVPPCDVTAHVGVGLSRAPDQTLLASCASTTHNIWTAVVGGITQGGRRIEREGAMSQCRVLQGWCHPGGGGEGDPQEWVVTRAVPPGPCQQVNLSCRCFAICS